jgi:hypothetical protein
MKITLPPVIEVKYSKMIIKPNFERGQALVIITLAIIGLVGITGLAVDGGMAFSDRRHAQNAADTAAMAGALAKIRAMESTDECTARASMRTEALDMAEENGYLSNVLHSTVEVYSCDEDGSSQCPSLDANFNGASCPSPYTDDPEYLQVIINSYVDTFFARVLGIPQVHNRVQAIARMDDDDSGPLGNGEAIVSYSPVCENPVNFTVGGDAIVNVTGGGLFVNINDPNESCGFVCNSTGAEIHGDITSVGGTMDLSDHCGESVDGTVTEDTGGKLDFPITFDDIGIKEPDECSGALGTYTNYPQGADSPEFVSGFSSEYPQYTTEPITVIHPGYFSQFPPPKDQPSNDLNDVMFLDPGTYCVGEVLRWNQAKFVLIGHDVTLFIRKGYGLALTGGVIDIDAPDSGDYAGYLIIVEPDYGSPDYWDNAPTACTINGAAANNYEGTIWAPYCDCMIDGGSEPTGFNAQVLCYTVKITGNSTISFTYDPGVNGEANDPPEIGLAK